MTDIKGSALPSASSLSLTDLILVIINPGTSPETRNATLSVLATALAGSVAGTLTAGDDPRVTGAVQASTLGDAAFADFGATAGTACAGDDTRVANAQLYTWASFSNADYPVQSSDRFVAQIGTMSAAHTVTLPAANSLNPGETILIIDISGTVSSTNKLNVAVTGSDTINGQSSHAIIQAYEQVSYTSDGTSTWTRSGNHYGMTPVGDSDYVAQPTDKVIMLTTAFTAARTITLPAISSVPLGYEITIQDANAVINPNSGLNLNVTRSGSDTINGSTTVTFSIARSGVTFRAYSNGWKYDAGALRKTTSQVKLADGWSVNNANTTLPSQTRYADVFALTGPITVTLPAAANVPYNQNILVADTSGNCSPTNTITVQVAGTDKLNGVTSGSYVIAQPYGQLMLTSNGSSFYTYSGSELKVKNNLSDVANAATARTNLGLGTAATQNTGTFLQVTNNLSDLGSASTARTNLGLDPVSTLKSNLSATTDPGTGNDSSQGYSVGSLWVNNSTNVVWIATNVGVGVAVWAKASAVLPDVQLYNAAGTFTWTKPANAKTVRVYGIGAGGGGGSGCKGAAGTVRCGGGGGGGGGYTQAEFRASDLNATETVSVGAGGVGGIAQTTNSTSGNGATGAGSTYFKGLNAFLCPAGGAGQGGTTSTGTAGAGGFSFSSGGGGAAASTTGGVGTGPGSAGVGGNGGAAGGGITSANAQSAGGQGASAAAVVGFWAGGAAGTAGGGNGANAVDVSSFAPASTIAGAPGGGGGGSNLTGNGGNGGNGGSPGGGGGGGGAAVDSTGNSGAGGNGGHGMILVVSL